jgi:ribitol-5-phosphate 2-dehydrogenase (NADP+) / D-ribitol-5-phosphate cytidylyltransferase
MAEKVYAIILASGDGRRFNSELPKQFIKLKDKSILEYSIEAFEKNKHVDKICIVINPLFRTIVEEIISRNAYAKVCKVLDGGKTRRESSWIGVKGLNAKADDIVLIHDAVRPLLGSKTISHCVKKLKTLNAVAVAIPASDTIYRIDETTRVKEVPDRKFLLLAQTPQGFRYKLIKKAHKMAAKDQNIDFSDDISMILQYELDDVFWVNGDEKNIKITYPIDEKFARVILKHKD